MNTLGTQGDYTSSSPSISADGRYIAFASSASNLVPGHAGWFNDIFVRDRLTGAVELLSVNSLGAQGDQESYYPTISADGRYVAFESYASNLVQGDTNGFKDIFVHDRMTGVTERVSVDSIGGEANNRSDQPSISADGRYVAFDSHADNLVPGDTGWASDVFVHDRLTGTTKIISVDSFGTLGNGNSSFPSITADGRYVAFESGSSNLTPGDTNGEKDIFVHDLQTGAKERVSVNSLGVQGDNQSWHPTISADGRYVAFGSQAGNLVPGDTNLTNDIFVHDRMTSVTKRVSVNSLGTQGDHDSSIPAISADGRHVAFSSLASNLAPGDINGVMDIFVHDWTTNITERVSLDSLGAQGNLNSYSCAISANGRHVAFGSDASNLVSGDTNATMDAFVRDRWDGFGANSIHLSGPSASPVLTPLDLSWQATQGNSRYWLAYSQNMSGTVIGGHNFDIGSPTTLLATGINTTNGLGSWTSAPVPLGAAGQTIYFEVATQDARGSLYDSNVLAVTFY